MRRCANCKWFKSFGYMTSEERKRFVALAKMLGIEDYNDYGYCTKFPTWNVVSKDYICDNWEVKEK